jgi:hypothetical protein
MNKHTPGPWFWDDEVPTDYMKADWENIAPWLVDEKGDGVITGQIVCCNPADTRLIAAAPELLEALKGLLGVISETRGIPAYNAVLDAKKAIEKAEEQSCKS